MKKQLTITIIVLAVLIGLIAYIIWATTPKFGEEGWSISIPFWEPEPEVEDISYEVNIDVDGDGEPDFNIDVDGDGVPDENIDLDGNGVIDIEEDEFAIQDFPVGEGINETEVSESLNAIVDSPSYLEIMISPFLTYPPVSQKFSFDDLSGELDFKIIKGNSTGREIRVFRGVVNDPFQISNVVCPQGFSKETFNLTDYILASCSPNDNMIISFNDTSYLTFMDCYDGSYTIDFHELLVCKQNTNTIGLTIHEDQFILFQYDELFNEQDLIVILLYYLYYYPK